jgi:hypothetical protein
MDQTLKPWLLVKEREQKNLLVITGTNSYEENDLFNFK